MSGCAKKFWELLEKSVIVSGLIALGTVMTILYLCIKNAPVPDVLVNIGMIVIGFFFGGKVQTAQRKSEVYYSEYASKVRDIQDARPEKGNK